MDILTVTKPNNRSLEYDEERMIKSAHRYVKGLKTVNEALNDEALDPMVLLKNTKSKLRASTVSASDITQAFIMSGLELISKAEAEWKFASARALLTKLYKEAAHNRGYKSYDDEPYGSFYNLVTKLTETGVYRKELTEYYSKEDIEELGREISPESDLLFDYIGLLTLQERYLATDYDKNTMELPQERYMVIAMFIMHQEPAEKRMALVKEAYWAMSGLYMTVATPTMSNAGKATGGQMSSCFIDTIDDSIEGIFDSNTDAARLSKMGGGIGVYMGKVRSRGSDIRGHKNTSSGVVPWIRQLNNTAVSVDQLGTRKGAIAVYLDVFHKDILAFLDIKLNNGDERMRAHDIFHGVCIPDIFMEAVIDREDFHLFCPHEVKQAMGWKDAEGNALGLEDFYDEEFGKGTFRTRYQEAVNHPMLSRITVPALDIMKRIMKSQLETGTPYMFYRDTANRANPNNHCGMIYSSNLCTEIMQNQSPTVTESEQLVTKDGKTRIIISKIPGDFVVCNLNSTNLARAVPADVLERVVKIQVRMLDNVIDINEIGVLQAEHTNRQYRAVGLGTFGLHHLLTLERITWESDEAVAYNDSLYEKINFIAITASKDLAIEKGRYNKFEGSDWHTGKYFDKREYVSEEWVALKEEVREHGLRNAWIMAIAPNGSTSIIAGTTATIDPIYDVMTYEEKTTYKIANPAPDLSRKTFFYFKSAFNMDQHASLRSASARARHIDQGQSLNLYVKPDIKATDFLELHKAAWKGGNKATYYVRSRAVTIDKNCEGCES